MFKKLLVTVIPAFALAMFLGMGVAHASKKSLETHANGDVCVYGLGAQGHTNSIHDTITLFEKNGKKYYQVNSKDAQAYTGNIHFYSGFDNGINVKSGKHKIILHDARFNDTVCIGKDANVEININGKCSVKAGLQSQMLGLCHIGRAGIELKGHLSLSGDGAIYAYGSDTGEADGGAGIGSNPSNIFNGKLTIRKVTQVYAYGGEAAAGIGAGSRAYCSCNYMSHPQTNFDFDGYGKNIHAFAGKSPNNVDPAQNIGDGWMPAHSECGS